MRLAGIIISLAMLIVDSEARDRGQFAKSTPEMKKWFDGLIGSCCSDADGTALSDVDWESKNGHFRVRLNGQWMVSSPNIAFDLTPPPERCPPITSGPSTRSLACFGALDRSTTLWRMSLGGCREPFVLKCFSALGQLHWLFGGYSRHSTRSEGTGRPVAQALSAERELKWIR
jgi:hypothetical protein